MPTRNLVLTDHHENVIESLVSSGRYQNASEVLREGLRLVERREAMEQARLEALKSAARAGFADLEQGRFIDVDDADLEDALDELGRHDR
jgi:antitoxin ParD1/3/4